MAYINTGTARSLKISVNKKVGGNQVQGYPKTYDGQQSWGNPLYVTLTDTQLRQLSDTDFNTRYAAFVAYVESVEDGLDFDTDIVGDGASKYDLTLCGTTTTTTAAPVRVYAFSIQYGKFPVDVCGGTSSVVYSSSSSPVVGTVLYKDVNLTQKWNVTNGEHIRFMSPVLYGGNAVNVSLTTGKILAVTTFNCSGLATTTTTTAAAVQAPSIRVDLANNEGNVTQGIISGNPYNMLTAGSGSVGSSYFSSISIVNTGTSNLVVSDVSESSDVSNLFSLSASDPWTISPGLSVAFYVSFNVPPSAVAGTYSATYRIDSNDSNSPFIFTLTISVL